MRSQGLLDAHHPDVAEWKGEGGRWVLLPYSNDVDGNTISLIRRCGQWGDIFVVFFMVTTSFVDV